MASDDAPSEASDRDDDGIDEAPATRADVGGELQRTRERIEEGAGEAADRAVEEFDQGIVDLLSWLLDTETRARIYVYLRQHPDSTSEEVADGTGLYPSTVREALADLHEEGTVTRRKRENAGAGNNPYEYEAIAPSELVRDAAGRVQEELNAVFNLDRRLDAGDGNGDDGDGGEDDPVTIRVDD